MAPKPALALRNTCQFSKCCQLKNKMHSLYISDSKLYFKTHRFLIKKNVFVLFYAAWSTLVLAALMWQVGSSIFIPVLLYKGETWCTKRDEIFEDCCLHQEPLQDKRWHSLFSRLNDVLCNVHWAGPSLTFTRLLLSCSDLRNWKSYKKNWFKLIMNHPRLPRVFRRKSL